MASPKLALILLLVYFTNVESASFLDSPIEYVMNLGRNVAPNFSALLDCFENKDIWVCAKTVAGKMLDGYDEDVEQQRRMWKESADAEVRQSGRQLEELPSKLGADIESSLFTLTEVLQQSIARSFSPKKHGGGGIDTITVTTGQAQKKDKKKKKKPQIHVMQMPMEKMEEKGPFQSWVLGHETHEKEPAKSGLKASEAFSLGLRPIQVAEGSLNVGNGSPRSRREVNEVGVSRGFVQDAWSLGERTVDSIVEHVMKSEEADNEIVDKSSLDEQRGKKKKKKKAILKLLLLGAVLKAKIGTMLQILSFKLQVKFLLIAIAGLLINLARFWLDVKKQGHQAPQKVIYYEHAQHQHHYDHEEEPGWSSGGPWSRSYDEGETGPEPDMVNNSPYRGQEKIPLEFIRPVPSRI